MVVFALKAAKMRLPLNEMNFVQIHITGMSNGGMLIWSRILERMSNILASTATVCSAPLRGFNPMPEVPINMIDFHGTLDNVIPISPDAPDNRGPGPDDTTMTNDGYYYHIKLHHLTQVLTSMHCDLTSSEYNTHMDGVEGWSCVQWSGCDQEKTVVHCTGEYGHGYPFAPDNKVEGLRILWDFMKAKSK